MNCTRLSRDVWGLIFSKIDVVSAIQLASTCRWLREHFRRTERIMKWQNHWNTAAVADEYSPTTYNTGLVQAVKYADLGLVKVFSKKATVFCWALCQASRLKLRAIGDFLEKRLVPREIYHVTNSDVALDWIACGKWLANRKSALIKHQNLRNYTYMAVIFADVDALDRFVNTSVFPFEMGSDIRIFQYAGKYGHINVLEWGALQSHISTYISFAAGPAASNNHMHVINWLHAYGVTVDLEVICHAGAVNGNIDMLEFARSKRLIGENRISDIGVSAVMHGHINVLEWAREHGYIRSPGRLKRLAAKRNKYEVKKWLDKMY